MSRYSSRLVSRNWIFCTLMRVAYCAGFFANYLGFGGKTRLAAPADPHHTNSRVVMQSFFKGVLQKLASLVLVVLGIVAGGLAAAAPPAPTPLGPVNGANVTVPATMSWSAVTDPGGAAIAGYNWKVSPSPSMAPVVFADSVNGTTTQDTLSGLLSGLYFWQVQAASSAGEQSAWSPAQSFNVTGVGPGTPGTPVLAPTRGYSTFHPFESVHFSWSAVPGVPTYRLEVSNNPNFPLDTVAPGVVTFWNDNIRTTTDGFVHHPSLGEGTFFARVFATDSDFAGGIRSLPSNVIQYTAFYNNPIGPAPVLLSPIAGETLTLPVTLTWAHVPNPQALGYAWEVAKDATFTTIEASNNQYTEPRAVMQWLTPGPKFWRLLSQHGLSSPTTNANTAWSTTGRFTVSAAPPVPVSIAFEGVDPPQVVYSGVRRNVTVQLSAAAPTGGATVALSSSNPSLAPVPPTITLPGGVALASFEIPIGQVTVATPVTLSATLNGVAASGPFTVMPPTLNNDPLQSAPVIATGGATMTGWVDLEGFGFAPAGGFIVNLATNSALAIVPSAVTIPAGARGISFQIQTSAVTTATTVTITASRNGVTTQWQISLMPAAAPTSFFVRPMATTSGSQGVVNAGEGVGFDQLLQVTSSNPLLASVPNVVTVFAGSGVGFFNIVTTPVTAQSLVTISVSGGGVTRSAPLTLYPALPALAALTVNPTSVAGGATATGSVGLASAAPAGGVAVNLGSNLPLAASVPASVTVPAGATSANFTVTTFPSALTTVQLSAALNNLFQFAAITVGPSLPPPPPPTGPTLSALSLSPTSVAGGSASTGTVTLSAPAPSGGAVVSLTDNSAATAVPASVTVPAGASSANFTVTTTSVTASTSATVSAVFGGVTRTAALTVNPSTAPPPTTPAAPTLISPAADATPAQPVTFDWSDVANATSYEIQVDDSSTIAAPFVANQIVSVSQASLGGLPAQRLWWRVRAQNSAGVFGPFSATQRFTPQAAPAAASLSAVSVNPTSVAGPTSSTGTATLTAAAPSGGAVLTLSSSNPAVASVPASVTVAAGASSASFSVSTAAVGANTPVTLTGTYNGTSRTSTLTVTPVPAPSPPVSLNTLALNPGSVTGGGTSQGSVTLTSAAPTGGAVVSLSSDAAVATVPASVTVAAGASSATFTATTASVAASTAATISAVLAGVTRTAVLTVNPPGANMTLTVSASGRSGERITSSPAGINVAVGSTQLASFAAISVITLSVSNGRDAIWSGACSSGGNKAKTCTFTINGNVSVSANVQ